MSLSRRFSRAITTVPSSFHPRTGLLAGVSFAGLLTCFVLTRGIVANGIWDPSASAVADTDTVARSTMAISSANYHEARSMHWVPASPPGNPTAA